MLPGTGCTVYPGSKLALAKDSAAAGTGGRLDRLVSG
jgi:hypothetical protein